jgi:pimeloyl-ACP methyl ester carboxylesterase
MPEWDRDIVLVHGGGMGGWVWNATTAVVKVMAGERIRCLAVDVPGCGSKRGWNIADIDNRDIAANLVDEIRDSGVRDAVLVGHSQAGMVIPFMTALAPTLFARVVDISCSAPDYGRSIMDTIGTGLHGSSPDQVGWPLDEAKTPLDELFRAMFCTDMSPASATAFMKELGSDSWPPLTYAYTDWQYGHLEQVASTYVVCLRDQILPAEWQRRFAQRLHAKRLIEVDTGHQAMNTHPEDIAAIILQHCGEAESANVSAAR